MLALQASCSDVLVIVVEKGVGDLAARLVEKRAKSRSHSWYYEVEVEGVRLAIARCENRFYDRDLRRLCRYLPRVARLYAVALDPETAVEPREIQIACASSELLKLVGGEDRLRMLVWREPLEE